MDILKPSSLPCNLILLGVSLVVAFLVGESIVRVSAPQQLVRLRPDIWVPSADGLGWRMRPFVDTTVNTGERSVRLQTDERGYRAPSGGYDQGSNRILALGDSFLAAIQVSYDNSMTALLSNELTSYAGRRWDVVNSGVGGWGLSHYFLEARKELSVDSYKGVLVFLFLGNDVETIRVERFPARHPAEVTPILWPKTFDFEGIVNAVGYPINNYFERRSHLFMFLRNRLWQLLMKAGLSARRFPESVLVSEVASFRWSVAAQVLSDIDALCRDAEIPLLVVLVPAKVQVVPALASTYAKAIGLRQADFDLSQPSRILRRLLSENNIDLVDLLPEFRQAREAGAGDLFGQLDNHFSPEGHRLATKILMPKLKPWAGPSCCSADLGGAAAAVDVGRDYK